MTLTVPVAGLLPADDAATYAEWFTCLSDATRVRILHAVAVTGRPITIGELTEMLGIGQSTCSHHVRKLADVGFVQLRKAGTATLVSVNPSCTVRLPQAADIVMGLHAIRPPSPPDRPHRAVVRALTSRDWTAVRRIYAEGLASAVETKVPPRAELQASWLPGHRWVADLNGEVVGWAAATAFSPRTAYAGVAETSVFVAEKHRGIGIGAALLHQQVTAADAKGLWTLQTMIFPDNRASLALHHAAGYRTVGVRERFAEHDGQWRDVVLLERRRPS